jgi:hypothetical protein
MAAETVTVYIDQVQLTAQKKNKYNLFLAKMVNGQFRVIWQSKGYISSDKDGPSYTYMNQFNISVPSYQVNYCTLSTDNGTISVKGEGPKQSIELGQTVELGQEGIFGTPSNAGTPGEITIHNQLGGHPNAELLDSAGHRIFVNTESGMDKGYAYLTPIDTYQIWFDNEQETGTIIAHNVSDVATVAFSGGTTEKVISYTADGVWQDGPLAQKIDLSGVGLEQVGEPITVSVLALFQSAMTVVALTYLAKNIIDKFGILQPKTAKVVYGLTEVQFDFVDPKNREILAVFGTDKYEEAVNKALTKAKADPAFNLQNVGWTVGDTAVTLTY